MATPDDIAREKLYDIMDYVIEAGWLPPMLSRIAVEQMAARLRELADQAEKHAQKVAR